jgi:GT2 family glycosyltransferase
MAWAEGRRRPVSIVIPSYNDIPLLTKCLESIAITCADFDYEVIVVDDYCQPANSAKLRRLEGERVRVIFKDQRRGFAVSVNRGMSEAKHDVVLLNSDIVTLPGWLEALQFSAYEGDPLVGIVSARLLYPDGRIQYGGTFWARTWLPQWFAHRYAGQLAHSAPSRVPTYNWGASGACLYVTRQSYHVLGGLDESYWLGFEDVDYSMRAWEHGIRSFYEPRANLFHHESATRGLRQGNRELGSLRVFWSKWAHLHTSKTGGTATREVDFVVDPESDPLWRSYLDHAAGALVEQGWIVRTHQFDATDPEQMVAALHDKVSLKVATSPALLDAVWLSAVLRGIPVYLMPELPSRPSAELVAALKSDFDFIAPTRAAGAILQAHTAWPAIAHIGPAIPPLKISRPATEEGVVVLTADRKADAAAIARVEAIAPAETIEIDGVDPALLARLRELSPRAIVCLATFDRPLEPLALMSLGAAYLSWRNDTTAYEVMDGLDSLQSPRGDSDMLAERLSGILEDKDAFESLRENGFRAAERVSRLAAAELGLALGLIAETRA